MKIDAIDSAKEPSVELVREDFAQRRPKLTKCDETGDNQRHMRSASIVYIVPANYLWNQFVESKAEPLPQKLMPVVDQKYGKYSPQEDKVLRNALHNPALNLHTIATQLNRSVGSVKTRMRKLQQEKNEEKDGAEGSSDSSMDVLEKFLAVEEDSSVDIDAAADALDYFACEPADPTDLPDSHRPVDQMLGEVIAGMDTADAAAVLTACDDLVSLQTMSDLSSTAINFLSTVVKQEKEKLMPVWVEGEGVEGGDEGKEVVREDNSTLSDSGASTYAQVV